MGILGIALLQQLFRWNRRGHSAHRLAALAHLFKSRLHAALQMKTAIKNDIRLQQPRHIVTRGLVEVRIDAVGNQGRHLRPFPRDFAHEVRHHAGRANNLQGRTDGAKRRKQNCHSRTDKKFHRLKTGALPPALQGNAHVDSNSLEPKIWTIVKIFGSPHAVVDFGFLWRGDWC